METIVLAGLLGGIGGLTRGVVGLLKALGIDNQDKIDNPLPWLINHLVDNNQPTNNNQFDFLQALGLGPLTDPLAWITNHLLNGNNPSTDKSVNITFIGFSKK